MWVFFDGGFVSIVKNEMKPKELLVRARARQDLERFCDFARVVGGRILETPARDYRYRRSLTRTQVTSALAAIALGIDYGNFKQRVAEKDLARAHTYGEVWTAALPIDPRHVPVRRDEGRFDEYDDGQGP